MLTRRGHRVVRSLTLVLIAALAAWAPTSLARHAARRHHGGPSADPHLDVPHGALAAALECTGPSRSRRRPVLLVHGTGVTPEESWSWNYARTLPTQGWRTCTVRLPDRAMGDIQTSAEYVVWAVERLHALTGRKVVVITHSQGGLEARWALRWWRAARRDVDDLIDLASPNHGLAAGDAGASSGNCWPAVWQMATRSRFVHALNSIDETPGDISYTQIYSRTDELVEPSSTAPLVAGNRSVNIAVQEICPGRVVHHVGMLEDAVVYDAVVDVISHDGLASPGRIPRSACAQTLMPGVTAADASAGNAELYSNAALSFFDHAGVPREPQLRPYARPYG